MDEKSLSHTSWNCKYHIVIVPKYRRKTIYGKLRKDIGKILRMLCDYKHVEIIEAHAMPDHIHMLLSIPPKLAVADFMGYLTGIVAPMGPFCIPRVSTRGYDCSTPLRKRELLRMRRFRQGARKNKENFGKKREPGGLVLLICFLPTVPDRVPAPHPPARRKCLPGCDTRHPERPDLPLPGTR